MPSARSFAAGRDTAGLNGTVPSTIISRVVWTGCVSGGGSGGGVWSGGRSGGGGGRGGEVRRMRDRLGTLDRPGLLNLRLGPRHDYLVVGKGQTRADVLGRW